MPRPLPPVWLAAPGRFNGISRRQAWWVAAVLAILLLASFGALRTPPTAADTTSAAAGQITDLMLYDRVIDDLRAGGDYYALTADALRAGSYPLRPFLTFRLPTHAIVQAALPPFAVIALLWLLAIGVAVTWIGRLTPALGRLPSRIVGVLLLAGGMAAFVQPELTGFHEIWAGLLIALSLGMRRPGRWVPSVALALIAMLVRETAAPFALAMGVLAWLEGGRREALGWAAALGGFGCALVAHAWAVAQVTGPLDPASAGWSGLLGFGFFVKSVIAATALQALPMGVAAPLVVLALFGWAGWRDPLALRAIAIFSGYALAIGVFARADTFYWGLLVAPVLLVGLAFAPDGLRDLGAALLDRRRVRVQIVSP